MSHCGKCGKQIDLDDKFCQSCGEPIEEGGETSSQEGESEAERKAKEEIITETESQSPKIIDRGSKTKTTVVILSVLSGILFLGLIGLGFMWYTTNDDLEATESQLTTKTAELNNAQTENSTLNMTISGLESDVTNLEQENASLEQENSSLQNSLDEINEVFPPREFSSLYELQQWLYSNDISDRPVTTTVNDWHTVALDLQKDALNDGYIVSVDYDYYADFNAYGVWCTTVINGESYFWDPETDVVDRDYEFPPG